MNKKNRKPAIRFKAFNDPWEQRKLDDISKITMGQSPDGSTYSKVPTGHILVQGNADLQNGWVKPRIWTTQVTKTAEAGDLIMSVRAPAGAMGKTAYDVVIGRGVAAIKANEFTFQLLLKLDVDGFWKNYSCGSTFDSLNSGNIRNAQINIPKIEEQQKIGKVLHSLDTLVTLHQRKLDKLQNVKKACLVKMFPQNGESVPRIRFKGFTDTWEQRKLTDIVEFFSGLTYTPNDVNEFGTLVLRSSNVVNNEIVDADNVYVNPAIVNTENVKPGDIIVVVRNGSRTLIGKHAQINQFMPNTVIGAFMTGIRSRCPSFTNALLNTHQFDDEVSKNMGATINQITGYMFSKMEFLIPVLEEQEKVGHFFRNIDNLITLHQRKLDKLKNLKKACLEKMFV